MILQRTFEFESEAAVRTDEGPLFGVIAFVSSHQGLFVESFIADRAFEDFFGGVAVFVLQEVAPGFEALPAEVTVEVSSIFMHERVLPKQVGSLEVFPAK
jgi:hypothetical protein